MKRVEAWLTVAFLIWLNAVGIVRAREKDPMNIEGGVLDEIHLKVPSINAGVPLVIRPFLTDGVNLGTGGEDAKSEKRSDATKAMVQIGPEMLVKAFRSTLLESGKFKELPLEAGATAPDDTLLVEGRFLKIDPGSRAKRYWGGFGAGKSGVQVTGTVKDASGKVLAEFTHMKHSGFGVGGGDYVKFLSDDNRDVGRDIALFLVKWAVGEDLHRD